MELPPPENLKALVRRYAELYSLLQDEIEAPVMVLPNGKFFPDRFTKDSSGVAQMMRRLQQHTHTTDIPIEVSIVEEALEESSKACASGGCAPLSLQTEPGIVDTGSGWRLQLSRADLNHPVALGCHLSRSLAWIFLHETLEPESIPTPVELSVELAAVNLGLGPLLLEGAYIYSKSCGGPSVARLTKFSVGELAAACAAFNAMHTQGRNWGAITRELSPTQKELFVHAREWAETSPGVFRALRSNPEALALGPIEFGRAKGFWQRLFSGKRADESLEAALLGDGDALEQGRQLAAQSPKRRMPKASADLRGLVEESLAER